MGDNHFFADIIFHNAHDQEEDLVKISDAMFNGDFVAVLSKEASNAGIALVNLEYITGGFTSATPMVAVKDVANTTASTSEVSGEKLSMDLAETAGLMPSWAIILLSILALLLACTLLYRVYIGWTQKESPGVNSR